MIRLIPNKLRIAWLGRRGIVSFLLAALASTASGPSFVYTHTFDLTPAPVNVRASDGTFPGRIEIDWDQPASDSTVNHWLVYRSTQPDAATAVQVDTSTNTHSISDDVIPGTVYNFWVKACTQQDTCSELSAPDSGYAGVISAPEAPVNVRASDGMFSDRIEINWDQPASDPPINHWFVYRSTQPDAATAVQVDTSTNTHSISEDVIPGTVYTFWVKACTQQDTCSELSAPDSGSAGVVISQPEAPVNVRASDGTFPGRIEIDWDQPASDSTVTHWLVYRSTQPDAATAVQVDTSTNTHSISEDVIPGTVYTFWVKACTQQDTCSELSAPDSGSAGVISAPEAPVNVRASDGMFSDRIEINWDQPASDPPIDHWFVYRSTQPDAATAIQVDTSTNTRSISEDIIPGVEYFYWVQACLSSALCSELSKPDSGFAGGSPLVVKIPLYLPIIQQLP